MAFNKIEISIPFFKKAGGAAGIGGGAGGSALPTDAVTTDNTSDNLITDAGDYIIQG